MKKIQHTLLLSSVFLLITTISPAQANQCSAKSGPFTTPLLELYTSEGCSSCPPADEWLSKLNPQKNNVTPLAFHVDYWDYIGWTDLFAKPAYSERQRVSSAKSGSRFVYTPQFLLNGRDYRDWQHLSPEKAAANYQHAPARASLTLMLDQEKPEWTLKANALLRGGYGLTDTKVYIALYQNGLKSEVKLGENQGRTLSHDYVVRELFGEYTLNRKSMFSKEFDLGSKWNNRDAGAVIFVQDKATGEIIQSLALPFCST